MDGIGGGENCPCDGIGPCQGLPFRLEPGDNGGDEGAAPCGMTLIFGFDGHMMGSVG